MHLSQLRAIIAVADLGNFSEAALSLNVSQSSVSHAIASLEEELGVPLFVRGRHGAVLTPAGVTITEHARQGLQSIERMQQDAKNYRRLQGGQIRVAMFRSVATHVLPPIIARFRSHYPAIDLTLEECFNHLQVEQLLRENRVDIGFVYLPLSQEFETREVVEDEYVVLVSPLLQLDRPLPIDRLAWEDLAALPMILPVDVPAFADLYKHLATFSPPLNVVYKINYGTTIASMVKQGLGAAIMPRLAAEPIPDGVQVYSLPIPLVRTLGAAVLANVLHIPAVFAFLDLLTSSASPGNPKSVIPNL